MVLNVIILDVGVHPWRIGRILNALLFTHFLFGVNRILVKCLDSPLSPPWELVLCSLIIFYWLCNLVFLHIISRKPPFLIVVKGRDRKQFISVVCFLCFHFEISFHSLMIWL